MKKLFLFALTAASLSACKKDSENAPSKTDLLTKSTWRIIAQRETETITQSSSTPTVSVTDRYAIKPTCEQDNLFIFDINKSLILDEGLTRCITTDPQLSYSTWDFSGDQTKLLLPGNLPSSTIVYDVLELTSATLRIRSTNFSYSNGGSYSSVIETTFTAF